jgi:polar amino acid transport system substrate-binding protein
MRTTRLLFTARFGCLAVLAVASLLVRTAADDAPPDPRPLRIVGENYPPFEFTRDGVVTGINVEVAARIFDRLNVPLEFVADYPFPRSWAMLRSGHADAVPSVSYQPDREPYVYCTPEQKRFTTTGVMPRDYLWITEYVWFVNRRDAGLVLGSYEEVKANGYRVGICKDYSYDGRLRKAGLNMLPLIEPEAGFLALVAGRIDLFPMDRTVGAWLLQELGLVDKVSHLEPPILRKPYHMMFAKASAYPGLEAVWRDFYATLRAMRDSGEYAEIYNRYIVPAYPFPPPRPVLFVAEEWMPFEYLKDGKPRGIDVTIVDRIMKRLALPYEIQFYPWNRAWMLAERGKADAVLSVSYNVSREDVLYFTPEQRTFATTGMLPPDYLWVSEYAFFVLQNGGNAMHFESYEQLKRDGVRVGTNRGYSYDSAFIAADLSFREYPDAESGMRALVNGEIDMYPMDRTVGLAVLEQLGFAEIVTHLPRPLFSKPYLAPFVRGSDMPGNAAIMQAFNAQLRHMRETGECDDVVGGQLTPETRHE